MNRNPAALAFDLGASSGRAIVGELVADRGGERKLSITEVHRFPNEGVDIGGHLYWDILMILQEIKKGIRYAYGVGFAPTSYAIDTWGVDFGLLDCNGELLGNPYHYRDNQTQGIVEELTGLIGEETLFAESGLQFMPFNTIYQLYAMKMANSPKLTAAETLLLTPDLLHYFLTGIRTCEFTMATTTQLIHPVTRKWNKPLLKRLDIPDTIFRDPVPPGSTIGVLSELVCRELGVPQLQAIAVASHDTESAVAAVGMHGEPFAYLVCGTWSLLGTQLSDALLTTDVRRYQFSNEGGAGGTYQLLKNIMGLWILQQCKRKWDREGSAYSYAELTDLAASAPALGSLIDPDDPRFLNPPDMEAEIAAFCRETGQRPPDGCGETTRCIMESLALRYRKVLGQVEHLTGRTYPYLRMVGGGIQNEGLCRFTAGAIGRPVHAGPVEASAIGNLLVQWIADGTIADGAEAMAIVERSFPNRIYEPQDTEAWDEAYARFESIQTAV